MIGNRRREQTFPGDVYVLPSLIPGISLQSLASEACGATGFSTAIMRLRPNVELPFHAHDVSEAMTVLEGRPRLWVAERCYDLGLLDCAHVPAGVPHRLENIGVAELKLHLAYGSAQPLTRFLEREPIYRGERNPVTIKYFFESEAYELAPHTAFRDLFARRFGSIGICGGYGCFEPGASLPCHTHDFDESITIVQGRAVCLVQGARYELSGCGTAFVPRGRPHRFLNLSDDLMAMIWVYSGDEPDRRIVDAGYCSGEIAWPE